MNYFHFDLFVESVIILDSTNKIVYVNDSTSKLFNLSPSRMIKSEVQQIFKKNAEAILNFNKVVGEHNSLRTEIELDLTDNLKVDVQICISKISVTGIGNTLILLHDITLEKKLQNKYKEELKNKESLLKSLEEYKDNLEKFLVFLLFVITGFQFIAIQQTVTVFPAILSTAIRFILGGLFLGIIFYKEIYRWLNAKTLISLLPSIILYRCVGLGGFSVALKNVPSGIGSVMLASSSIFMYIMALLGRKEKFSWWSFTGIFLGLTGLTLLITEAPQIKEHLTSYIILIISVICFSVGVYMRPKNVPISSISLDMLIGGLALLVYSFYFENINPLELNSINPGALLGFIYLLIFVTLISDPALAYMFSTTSTTRANSFMLIRPIIALAIGWVINREKLTIFSIFGILISFISLKLIFKTHKKK